MDVVDGLTNPNLFGVVTYNLLLWFRCRFKNQIAIHLSRKTPTLTPTLTPTPTLTLTTTLTLTLTLILTLTNHVTGPPMQYATRI